MQLIWRSLIHFTLFALLTSIASLPTLPIMPLAPNTRPLVASTLSTLKTKLNIVPGIATVAARRRLSILPSRSSVVAKASVFDGGVFENSILRDNSHLRYSIKPEYAKDPEAQSYFLKASSMLIEALQRLSDSTSRLHTKVTAMNLARKKIELFEQQALKTPAAGINFMKEVETALLQKLEQDFNQLLKAHTVHQSNVQLAEKQFGVVGHIE